MFGVVVKELFHCGGSWSWLQIWRSIGDNLELFVLFPFLIKIYVGYYLELPYCVIL